MAMLAGPRRKQKVINLRAKNNAWSNDANKFGQRMLEKMGWSSGKGLGAKENGIVEHVVAKYKNDDRGLGYDDKNDQWTKHEDDFNSLLANLSNGNNNDEKLHSGISLEDKSKKSKARVHYHKFTRGKDLTKYSEKDLANIFGKKSLKNEVKPEEILKEDNVQTTEQVFTEKGSMEDYFKSKLAAFKSQNSLNYKDSSVKEDNEAEYGFQGFSNTNEDEELQNHQGFGFQGFSFYSNGTDDKLSTNIAIQSTDSTEVPKKSKKKKKLEHQNEELSPSGNNSDNQIVEECPDRENVSSDVLIKKSKKKKSKHQNEELSSSRINCDNQNSEENPVDSENISYDEVTRKSKKKKRKNYNEEEEFVETKLIEKQIVTELITKNNSKKKKKCVAEITEDNHVPKKKKKRKCVDAEG